MPTGEIITGTINRVRSRFAPRILRSSNTAIASPSAHSIETAITENASVTRKLWRKTSESSKSVKLSKPAKEALSGW